MPRVIHETAVIGATYRYLEGFVPPEGYFHTSPPSLPESIFVGPFAMIGNGAILGERVVIDAYGRVDVDARVGDDTQLLYRGTIGAGSTVGNGCIVGGSVSEGTQVGDHCRTFGLLIHSHHDSTASWDFRNEAEGSVVLHHHSFVGHGAIVIGDVQVGPYSYVCAGAVITRRIPPRHIGCGHNRIVSYKDWPGPLARNPLFGIHE